MVDFVLRLVEGFGEERLMVVAGLAHHRPPELAVRFCESEVIVRRLVRLWDDLVVSGVLHGRARLRPADV